MALFRVAAKDGSEIARLDTDERPVGDTITVGRSSDCTLSLKGKAYPDRTVGASHFAVVRRETGWYVRDLGSTGIFKDGKPIRELRVDDGDYVTFGNCLLLVGGKPGVSAYDFFYQTSIGRTLEARLWMGRNWLGLSPQNMIRLEDAPNCSRRHACITVDGDGVLLEDAGSSNGTWVSNRKITEPVRVKPGEPFRLGKTKAWVDVSDKADFYMRSNTLLKDRHFRLLVGLVIIIVLMTLKQAFFGSGWLPTPKPHATEHVEDAGDSGD